MPKEHIVVDVAEKDVKNVGGALSSRRPVKYLDENGNFVKGYFTENGSVKTSAVHRSQIANSCLMEHGRKVTLR